MQKNESKTPRQEANQTVRVDISTSGGPSSIRIGFTDQRLTAHGGMVVWSHFLQGHGFREVLADLLPHCPSSPNAFAPSDTALGLLGGIISGADKLSRVAWLACDPAVAEVLGIEAVPSQSTLTRFLGVFSQRTSTELGKLHAWAAGKLSSHKGGYTLDMDSWSLLHQGAWGSVRGEAAGLQGLLGDGGAAPDSDRGLQPLRPAAKTTRTAGPCAVANTQMATVHQSCGVESSPGQTHT